MGQRGADELAWIGDGSSDFSSPFLLRTDLFVPFDLNHFRMVDSNHYRSRVQLKHHRKIYATTSEFIGGLAYIFGLVPFFAKSSTSFWTLGLISFLASS